MTERIRVGVIGVGVAGVQHLNSLFQCSRATAVAVAEPVAGRAKEVADRFRIPRSYLKYAELLEQPDIDAVTIAVPNHLHAEVAVDALLARKHVFLEKPMALNAREAQRIVEAARKVRRTLMVGMPLRFDRDVQAARLAIARGDLGDIYHVRCQWIRRQGIPRIGSWLTRKETAGGGCFADLGVSMIDLAFHLLGEFDVRSVQAHLFAKFGPRGEREAVLAKNGTEAKRAFDVEDSGVALIRMKSGRAVMLEISWAANPPVDRPEKSVDIYGTSAGLTLFPARVHRAVQGGFETLELSKHAIPGIEDRVHEFVTALVEDRRPAVTLDESLKVQRALDGLYASADTGREFRFDPAPPAVAPA